MPALNPDLVAEVSRVITRGTVALVSDVVHGRIVKRLEGGRTVSTVEFDEPLPPLPDLSDGEDRQLGESLRLQTIGTTTVDAETGDAVFAGVVGLDYEKGQLRRCIDGPWSPNKNILLSGPPGSAKTMFLEALRPLPETRYIVGQRMTPAGLHALLSEGEGGPRPRILLIDELDKTPGDAQAALLTVIDGSLAPAIHGAAAEEHIEVQVVAAVNEPARLIVPLRQRFIELPLTEYTTAEREAVLRSYLRRREVPEERAADIATRVAAATGSVREGQQLAEMELDDPALAEQMAQRLRLQRLGRHRVPRGRSAARSSHTM